MDILMENAVQNITWLMAGTRRTSWTINPSNPSWISFIFAVRTRLIISLGLERKECFFFNSVYFEMLLLISSSLSAYPDSVQSTFILFTLI